MSAETRDGQDELDADEDSPELSPEIPEQPPEASKKDEDHSSVNRVATRAFKPPKSGAPSALELDQEASSDARPRANR